MEKLSDIVCGKKEKKNVYIYMNDLFPAAMKKLFVQATFFLIYTREISSKSVLKRNPLFANYNLFFYLCAKKLELKLAQNIDSLKNCRV